MNFVKSVISTINSISPIMNRAFIFMMLIAASFVMPSHAEGLKGIPGLPWKFLMPGEGYSLAVTYAIWIAVVAALYPFCKWYDRYKSRHPEKKWLSYL